MLVGCCDAGLSVESLGLRAYGLLGRRADGVHRCW